MVAEELSSGGKKGYTTSRGQGVTRYFHSIRDWATALCIGDYGAERKGHSAIQLTREVSSNSQGPKEFDLFSTRWSD